LLSGKLIVRELPECVEKNPCREETTGNKMEKPYSFLVQKKRPSVLCKNINSMEHSLCEKNHLDLENSCFERKTRICGKKNPQQGRKKPLENEMGETLCFQGKTTFVWIKT
jgi:hypothetical protein